MLHLSHLYLADIYVPDTASALLLQARKAAEEFVSAVQRAEAPSGGATELEQCQWVELRVMLAKLLVKEGH